VVVINLYISQSNEGKCLYGRGWILATNNIFV